VWLSINYPEAEAEAHPEEKEVEPSWPGRTAKNGKTRLRSAARRRPTRGNGILCNHSMNETLLTEFPKPGNNGTTTHATADSRAKLQAQAPRNEAQSEEHGQEASNGF